MEGMSQKNNISQSDDKMSEESCRLYVQEELQQKCKQGQTLQSELNIMKPQLSNQIESLESEVKTLQSELQEERSQKTKMQESHLSEIIDLQLQLKGLKEGLLELSELLSKEEKKESSASQIISLQRENQSLDEENKQMVSLIVQLESLCERQRVEKESLQQELQRLRESERIINDNLSVATGDQSYLQEKMDAEVQQLRAAMQVLQDNESIANEQIHNLKADLLQLQESNRTKDEELELLRATLGDFEHLTQETQQNRAVESELLRTVAELEQLKKKMEMEKQTAMEKNEKSVKSFSQEMIDLESLLEKTQAETECLYTQVSDLRKEKIILNESIQSLKDEVVHLESVREKNQEKIHSLTKEVLELKYQVKEAQDVRRERDEVQQKLTHAESLLEKKQLEDRKYADTYHKMKDNEDFLYEQNEKMSTEVARLETLVGEKNKDNQNLKKTLRELQCQLEEDIILIQNNRELLQKKEMIIAEKEQEIKEHDNIRMTLRQSIRDLKDQLERRQEEILAGVEGTVAQLPETSNFLDKQINDIPMQFPQEQPPAPVAQSTSFLSRCAGGVLKAGLTVGIAAAGILALGYAGCSYDTDGSATKRILGCVYQMIEPYCDMTYITPPPF
ncbi:hypothetical protein GBF38_020346 [Nibea albiflora]|uniref:Uncharacterized protein n=1 Tax=Nibea albiflora TaxID=240163 RepID=A0ACB7FDG0_NIBAL|nr:hypothetical protein GBF38_020346 [Nibea albiflora]